MALLKECDKSYLVRAINIAPLKEFDGAAFAAKYC
jgi:hypothetical protein